MIIAVAGLCYVAMSACWLPLAASQWSWRVALITVLPLVIVSVLMTGKKPVTWFYAALVSLPYIATAMTQIMMGTTARLWSILCLALGLIYMTVLRHALRALRTRL